MSTLFVNNLTTASGSTITVPTGKKIIGTDNSTFVAPGMTLQTVSGTFTDVDHSFSGTSFADIDTSLNLSITPKFSTSKLLITGNIILGVQDDSAPVIRLLVNGSEVGSATNVSTRAAGHTGMSYIYYTSRGGETYYEMFSNTIHFLTGAVGTTSAIVCKPQYRNADGSGVVTKVNVSAYGADVDWIGCGVSSFTVQEIAQ